MWTARHRLRRAARAFSLIEMLVVLVLMVAIVSVLGEVFGSADEMTGRGGGRAASDNQARQALQAFSADLREAVADPLLNFRVTGTAISNATYGCEASAVYAVTLAADTGTGRAARVVGYEVRPSSRNPRLYDLVRCAADVPAAVTGAVSSVYMGLDLQEALAGAERTPVAQGVALFRVGACDTGGIVRTEFDAATDGWPRYVDVYLELLDEGHATKVADLLNRGVTNAVAWTRIDEWARRYTARIHFDNRYGYRDR